MELTEQEIHDLIIKFSLDESIDKLEEYYSTPTTWEIIKQSRRETSHTQFLAWFFGNSDLNADANKSTVKKLIILLLKWSSRQTQSQFDQGLKDSIFNQNFLLKSVNVQSEVSVNVTGEEPCYGEGDIDILISCDAEVNKESKKINIVIENKIDSPETTKCFDADGVLLKKPNNRNTAHTLYQTDAYYDYITQTNQNDINLFVYLKPSNANLEDIQEAECNNKKYIQINYQELLDNIIQPVCDQKDISNENRYRLRDYIRTLGKPSETENKKKVIIMAIAKEEKKLLERFFYDNQELIRASIEAVGGNDIKEALGNIEKDPKDRTKYKLKYTLNDTTIVTEPITKSHLASEVVKIYILMHPTITEQQLKNKFAGIKGTFFEENITGQRSYDRITIGRKDLYIHNGVWGAGTSAFENLINKIGTLNGITLSYVNY